VNSAEYVDNQITKLKNKGIPLSEAAWKAALLCVGWPYIFGDRGEYCTPQKREAVYKKHGGEALINKCQVLKGSASSCSGCKWFPSGKRVRSFDCRGFTYWDLLQIFGWKLMGAGCTAQWNNKDNWRKQGAVKDGIPQDVIVCLFYRDKKNPKVMAHTGLYYNGETCECSSGVQHFTKINKKWEYWGVPACVQGDIPTPTPPEPEPVKKPTLRRGSTGPYVVECQTDLIKLGYDVGKTGADGIFGKNTESGVKSFQKQHFDADGNKLVVDGVVGQKTWYALDKAVSDLNGG
jgi:hypothetical protein